MRKREIQNFFWCFHWVVWLGTRSTVMHICTIVGKPIWVYYNKETDEEQSICAQIWPLRCCQHQSDLPNDTICTNGNSSIGRLSSRADLVKLLKEYCIWRDCPLQRCKKLVLLHGPLRLCRMWSFTDLGGKGSGILNFSISLDPRAGQACLALSSKQQELAPSFAPF